MAKDFDIIVYGASGFTGRLVAEYLDKIGHKSFAMAGRNEAKLAEVRDEMGIDAPLVIADGEDEAALKKMAESAKTVVTLVGPYQLYGEKLLKACIDSGTDYTDLCGEPAWMAAKIREAHDAAKATGARIVFSCGFDSIPSDCGMLHLQNKVKEATGGPAERVKLFVRKMKGTFSGGTAASFKATMKAAFSDPQVLERILAALGLPAERLSEAQAPAAKAQLRSETETAVSLGIFGAPTFAVDGEIFWGNDRLEAALAWAKPTALEARDLPE